MARGIQLSQLVSDLRAETGRSQRVAVGTDTIDALKFRLQSWQEMLFDAYDWDHMRLFASTALSAGLRYYSMPSGMSDMRIDAVACEYNGQPIPIEKGIGFSEYIAYDSDADERADPVLRWDFARTSSTATQIEVWPIPASGNMTLWFKGRRDLPAFIADSDVCALDGLLIVLAAAADMLAAQESPGASRVAAKFEERLRVLKARSKPNAPPIALGQGPDPMTMRGRSQVVIAPRT